MTAVAFYEKAIEVSTGTNYINTLIPAHYRYAHYLLESKSTEGKAHLQKTLELAKKSGWDLMVDIVSHELASMQ